jgi:DNA-binding transcriptional regulator GbsR (MarR family)
VAQIHALLYLSDRALDAEEIAETLGVARSNVSTSLRELLSWGVIRSVHLLGERREHFESLESVWEMLHRIALERKKREMDPTLSVLRECAMESEHSSTSPFVRARLEAMLSLFELASRFAESFAKIPPEQLPQLAQIAESLVGLLPPSAEKAPSA